jgi:hypothetical protein
MQKSGVASVAALLVVTSHLTSFSAQAASLAERDLNARMLQLEQMLREQEQRISRQEKRLAQQEKVIAEQQKALRQQRQASAGPSREAPSPAHRAEASTNSSTAPAAVPPPQPAAAPPAAAQQRAPVTASKQPSAEPPAIEQIADIGGVLLPKGGLVLEPGLEYTHSSARRVEIAGFSVLPAIVIGDFDLRSTSRNTIVGSVTGRYGLTDRLEIEAKLPYVYRSDRTTGRPFLEGSQQDISTSASGNDLGDVELAAHYQINDGQSGWPYFVGNLRVRAPTGTHPFEVERDPTTNLETELPTGTGFWGFEPSLTMIMPSDPAVYYANLSYLYNMERSFGGSTGTVDPGDSIGFSFGSALAINERSSFSLGGDFQLVRPTTQNGQTVAGSEDLYIGRGILGFTQKVSDSTSVNLSFSFGVTEDAPDFQLGLRMPITLY